MNDYYASTEVQAPAVARRRPPTVKATRAEIAAFLSGFALMASWTGVLLKDADKDVQRGKDALTAATRHTERLYDDMHTVDTDARHHLERAVRAEGRVAELEKQLGAAVKGAGK